MSWHTKLEIQGFGEYGDFMDLEAIAETVKKRLDEDGIHPVVYADLKEAFEKGEAIFNLHPAYLQSLLRNVVPSLPEAHFEARCSGEEFRYTWVAEFRKGKETFSAGPWDYGDFGEE